MERGLESRERAEEALGDVALAHEALVGARMLACDMAEGSKDARLWALALSIGKAAELVEPLKALA